MLLHFVHDEKVTDDLIANFSAIDSNDIFLVFSNTNNNADFKHITVDSPRVIRFDPTTDNINIIIVQYQPTGILLHSFSYKFALAVLAVKPLLPIAWCGQGRDVYNLPRIEPYIYAPLTRRWLSGQDRLRNIKYRVMNLQWLRKLYCMFVLRQPDRYGVELAARKKISLYTSNIQEDFSNYSKRYPNSMSFAYSAFSSIDQFIAGDTQTRLLPGANSILIGNSNTPESNHLDALHALKIIAVDTEVIMPLNYGHGTEGYRQVVIQAGAEMFGDRFLPITTFMPKAEYVSLLQRCSVGIFFHYRQQAFGNIITMLFFGSRVYLSKHSPLYRYFLRIGVHVYSLEDDLVSEGLTKLEPKLAEENRNTLTQHYSHEQVLSDLRTIHTLLSS